MTNKANIWFSRKTLHYIYISISTLLKKTYHIKYYKAYILLKVIILP